jgi:energy-coupling factor transporter ATP-binding protein EcfA2
MFLKRIQVPDFRVLKNVDITFDPQLEPRVFPLGSQNGGGKSTLLQLIFVLLHCAIDPEKFHLVENLLQGFNVDETDEQRHLATVEIWDDVFGDIKLEYLCCSNSFLYSVWKDSASRQNLLASDNFEDDCQNMIYTEDLDLGMFKLVKEITEQDLILIKKINADDEDCDSPLHDGLWSARRILSAINESLLNRYNLIHLGAYSTKGSGAFLTCRLSASNQADSHQILETIASKIFLAAPSTQVFQFLPLESRKKMFSRSQKHLKGSYINDLQDIQTSLPNLFTYDFLLVDSLVNLFQKVRDSDFKTAIETGQYGNSYQETLKSMNSVLVGKKINSRSDLSGIRFHLDDNGNELQPEDLSHGELKRFSIYMWLSSQNLKDAIVLMDEIEIALHPDWQYQIVHDLVKWGPTNQYILATHSYELCQAVTPAHVKEITPNLLPQTV